MRHVVYLARAVQEFLVRGLVVEFALVGAELLPFPRPDLGYQSLVCPGLQLLFVDAWFVAVVDVAAQFVFHRVRWLVDDGALYK